MRMIALSTLAGGLALAAFGCAPASAAAGVGAQSVSGLAAPEVILVSGGCGPFRHRGFNGFCYPNRGYGYGYGYGFRRPYGYYRPYGYGYRRPFGVF